MDLAQFTTETLDFLWRPNDTDLAANMSKIVRTAENRLFIDLDITDEDILLNFSVDTFPSFPLPADCTQLQNLTWTDYGPGSYLSQRNFDAENPLPEWLTLSAVNRQQRQVINRQYTIRGRDVWHRWQNASPATPYAVELLYTPFPASLITDDDTVFNQYTAVYEAGVYHEASKFLKNLEDAAMYDTIYKERVEEADMDQINRKYSGSPLKMSMPRRDVS